MTSKPFTSILTIPSINRFAPVTLTQLAAAAARKKRRVVVADAVPQPIVD